MQDTQRHSSVESLLARIENMKASKAEYQKALRKGYYCGKRLTSEEREYIRERLDDLEYYIRIDTWELSRQAGTRGVA